MIKVNKKLVIIITGCLLFIWLALGLFFIWSGLEHSFEIVNYSSSLFHPQEKKIIIEQPQSASPLSGLGCQDYQRRPIAVILAADPLTRPLSGLKQADLVIEMSVITNSITRLMAVYVCNSPSDLGSVRSARHDFIPLAMGLDAILVHWGGSHFSLDKLNAGLMDNLDAMINPFNAFYRKKGVAMPNDGFTSIDRLVRAAQKLGYRLENKFAGYPHVYNSQQTSSSNHKLIIDYPYPYNIEYQYQTQTNSYLRWRGNKEEIDKLSAEQIEAKVIVVLRAASRQIEGPYYNDVDIEGQGSCQVYQNGQVQDCQWKKDQSDPASKLFFLDQNQKEIKFVPGQIWIEVVEPEQNIIWQ